MNARLHGGGATDVGRVRSINQDSALLDPAGLYAVADGMGGHAAGDVAARLALEVLLDSRSDDSLDALRMAVRWANRSVFQRSLDDPALRGMGTTLCIVGLVRDEGSERIAVLNVGDSRVYRWRRGDLAQLTVDHSMIEDLVRDGAISREEAKVHPQRHMVTRALGIDVDVQVDHWLEEPVDGDRYLLCSDGLTNEVSDEEIAAVLASLADPEDASRRLVAMANEAGGRDNVTVVVVDVTDDDGAADGSEGAGEAAGTASRTSYAEVDTDPGLPLAMADAADTDSDRSVAVLDDTAPSPEDTVTMLGGPAEAGHPVPAGASAGAGDAALTAPVASSLKVPRFTWRVGAFVLAVVAVVTAAVVAVVAWPDDDPDLSPVATIGSTRPTVAAPTTAPPASTGSANPTRAPTSGPPGPVATAVPPVATTAAAPAPATT